MGDGGDYSPPKEFLKKLDEMMKEANRTRESVVQQVTFSRLTSTGLRGTLGRFYVEYTGQLMVYPESNSPKNGRWSFDGSMRFSDT